MSLTKNSVQAKSLSACGSLAQNVPWLGQQLGSHLPFFILKDTNTDINWPSSTGTLSVQDMFKFWARPGNASSVLTVPTQAELLAYARDKCGLDVTQSWAFQIHVTTGSSSLQVTAVGVSGWIDIGGNATPWHVQGATDTQSHLFWWVLTPTQCLLIG